MEQILDVLEQIKSGVGGVGNDVVVSVYAQIHRGGGIQLSVYWQKGVNLSYVAAYSREQILTDTQIVAGFIAAANEQFLRVTNAKMRV